MQWQWHHPILGVRCPAQHLQQKQAHVHAVSGRIKWVDPYLYRKFDKSGGQIPQQKACNQFIPHCSFIIWDSFSITKHPKGLSMAHLTAAPFFLSPFSFLVLMNWWPEKSNHPENFWAYAAGWGSPLPKWNWTRPTQAYNPFALHSCPIVFCCPTGPPCSLGDGFVLTSWGTQETQTLVFRGVFMLQTRPDQEWNVKSRCFWWFNTFST